MEGRSGGGPRPKALCFVGLVQTLGEGGSKMSGLGGRALRSTVVCAVALAALQSTSAEDQEPKPMDFAEALDVARASVAMLEATVEEEPPSYGAGVIVGAKDGKVWIATANHVVRRGGKTADDIRVDLRIGPKGSRKGTLQEVHDPLTRKDGSSGLDLAVITVPQHEADVVPTDVLSAGPPTATRRVYPVGFARGEKKWDAPAAGATVAEVRDGVIRFQSSVADVGYSGGGLFDEHMLLAGIVRRDEGPNTDAISIDPVMRQLRKWRVPVTLVNGRGVTTISPEDRKMFPIGDASLTACIDLPQANPHVAAYKTRLDREMAAFAAANPRYDNTDRVNMFYVSSDDKRGTLVPTDVDITGWSSMFPKWTAEPEVFLACRMLTADLHFFRSAPAHLELVGTPEGPLADLHIQFSRMISPVPSHRGQNRHTTEISYSIHQKKLGLNAWEMTSSITSFENRGTMSSLLDLRDCTLAVDVTLGNAPKKHEPAVNAIRAKALLRNLNLSLGRRISIPEESFRSIDRPGAMPVLVFRFPASYTDLVKMFN